jgi:hypothetical protein
MTTTVDRPRWEKILNNDRADMPRRVSNSEVSAYQQCQRKWYYGYKLNLEPVTIGKALNRGIIGHDILAAYYTVLMNGAGNYAAAEKAAWSCFSTYALDDAADEGMLLELRRLLTRYFSYSRGDNWKILAVEQSYDIDVNDRFGYVMRLDLLVEINGRTVLVDHKFVYSHYDQNAIDLNAQMPKYIGALKFNGIEVDYAMLNEIMHRTRVKVPYTDEETFQRVILRPNPTEIRTILREQFVTSDKIIELYNSDNAESEVVRTMNMMTCKNCSFAKLCKSELMGEDITNLLTTDYTANSYGYNKTPDSTVDSE